MEKKFTKGEWKSDGLTIHSGDNVICSMYDDDGVFENSEANAKLIKAAPELLESLVNILQNFKSCIAGGNGELETDKEDIERAEAAIKKATE